MSGRWGKRLAILSKLDTARNAKYGKTSGPSTAEAGPHLGGKSALADDRTPATQDLRSVGDKSLTTSEISGENPSSLPLTEDDIWERLDDWVVSLPHEDTMMLSMLLFSCFRRLLKFGVLDAAEKVSEIVHHHERTIRRWNSTFSAHGEFPELKVGKYERQSIIQDEEVRRQATAWARDHTNIKGMPNMRIQDFCQHVNNDLLPFLSLPPGFPRKISL